MRLRSDAAPLRELLVDVAVRLVESDGSAALTVRQVAEAAGTSTMAVYTHFGGMGELRRAVRWHGFSRLADELAAVRRADPLDDLVALCVAYCEYGIAHPQLYRVMFMDQPLDAHDVEVCAGTFELLVDGTRRVIDTGALGAAEPASVATELWVAGHGLVSLRLSQSLPADQGRPTLDALLAHLLAAHGANAAAVTRSLERREVNPRM